MRTLRKSCFSNRWRVTCHTAFALPVNQCAGQTAELSSDLANHIRTSLFNLKLIIIDEISMVGSRMLHYIDTRLRQIKGVKEPFGGVSILAVGDLNHLPPVMDKPIYKAPKINQLSELLDTNPLWDEFYYYELNQIMCQKDETEFITCLNNLAAGDMTNSDIKLIKSRKINEIDVPENAIRLFDKNVDVNDYNQQRIENYPGNDYNSIAKDKIVGKASDYVKNKVLNGLINKKLSETGGYPYKLSIKKGIKYMITNNIDVEDGLVNGSTGCLKHILFEPNSVTETEKL
uniref:ATP-dependent DNA helicase n=1 Tax=Diabrotica virgifera virgifera TaxID=50390 RepID=A0A6P7H8C5_DIAVI